MTISTFQAAKTLCHLCHWKLSNLQIHKILYLSHMFFMGRTGNPMISEAFEAWDMGPVLPSLYRQVKFFGSDKIVDVFTECDVLSEGKEYDVIKEISKHLSGKTPGQLVHLSHRPEGAWAKHYMPNMKGIIIPNSDIGVEYDKLYGSK